VIKNRPQYVSGYPKRWGHFLCLVLATGGLFSYIGHCPTAAQFFISGLLIGNCCQALFGVSISIVYHHRYTYNIIIEKTYNIIIDRHVMMI
jgi:hypothetical protein